MILIGIIYGRSINTLLSNILEKNENDAKERIDEDVHEDLQ